MKQPFDFLGSLPDFRPQKRLGQHFIIDRTLVLAVTSKIPFGSDILEVGGGLGSLTGDLLRIAKKLTVVEADERLANYLKSRFKQANVVWSNFIDMDMPQVDYVVSAVPYYMSKQFILKLFRYGRKWKHALLILQKEFVEKLLAKPCQANYREISVLTQYAFIIEQLEKVPREYFYPQPKVDSALIRLSVKESYDDETAITLEKVTSKLFNYKNKTLNRALRLTGLSLASNQVIDPYKRRVGCLRPEEILELAKTL